MAWTTCNAKYGSLLYMETHHNTMLEQIGSHTLMHRVVQVSRLAACLQLLPVTLLGSNLHKNQSQIELVAPCWPGQQVNTLKHRECSRNPADRAVISVCRTKRC